MLHQDSTSAPTPAVTGVCPVLATPFHDDGTVDEDSFRRIVRHSVQAGAASVMFPGFASEYHKLAESERDRLVRVLFDELRTVPSVGAVIAIQDHATSLAVARATDAASAGAAAVNILPPYFLSPPSTAVVEHINQILDAIAPTPGIVQYAPGETGTALSVHSLGQIAAQHPNLEGVKVEARPSGPFLDELGSLEPPVRGIEGYAGLLLPSALDRGAVAVQPGCSFVELYIEIWNLYSGGDPEGAREFHARLLPYLSYWMTQVELIVAVEKHISALRGIISSPHCREPARQLDDAELGSVHRFLEEFADWLPDYPM